MMNYVKNPAVKYNRYLKIILTPMTATPSRRHSGIKKHVCLIRSKMKKQKKNQSSVAAVWE